MKAEKPTVGTEEVQKFLKKVVRCKATVHLTLVALICYLHLLNEVVECERVLLYPRNSAIGAGKDTREDKQT